MVVRLILLLLVVLGLLVGGHYLLYHLAVRAFAVGPGPWRRVLLTAALFMSLSFPLAMASLRASDNGVTGAFFFVAALWMGLYLNLLLATGAGALVAGGARLAGLRLDPRWLALGVAALAVAGTAWGGWRARHPAVRRIEVSLKDLPGAWRGRTVVHLSDLHLGHVQGPGFMRAVAAQVAGLKPDLILITGDLFDGPGGDFAACVPAIDRLKAPHGVFFSAGNHERYSRSGPVVAQTGLRVLDADVVEVDGLQIAGVAYPGLADEAALARFRKRLSTDKPAILLFHTPTDVLQRGAGEAARHFDTYWTPDTSCALNRELGVDLQLSGHTHAGQLFPFGLLTRLIYSGRDRGLHVDGDFNLFVSSGTGVFGPPLRTAGTSEIVAITLR